MLHEILAIGGGRGQISATVALVAGTIALGLSVAFLVRWNAPPERRPHWGPRGDGPPISRVGIAAWSLCFFVWAIVILTEPLKFIPHTLGFDCLMVATFGVFAAAICDGWATTRHREH